MFHDEHSLPVLDIALSEITAKLTIVRGTDPVYFVDRAFTTHPKKPRHLGAFFISENQISGVPMRLLLKRQPSKPNWTVGKFYRMDLAAPVPLCETLEDGHRDVKVPGETRIPAGEYEIKLRTEGTLTGKYAERYPSMHKGMLHLQSVPGFEWVYIHVGNTAADTEGCILVGQFADNAKGFLSNSRAAYQHIYPLISDAIINGEHVTIKIEDAT